MKPMFFAGMTLALSVPAWSQPQGAPPPPPAADNRLAPDDGPPQVGGPIRLQNPHRRGEAMGGPMMGGQGGGIMPFGQGGNTVPFPSANNRFGSMMDNTMPMPAPPPVSMFADERYLFILRGDTLMQFDKKSLILLKSVELPRPLVVTPSTPFSGVPGISGQGGALTPDGQVRSQTSPPLLRDHNGIGTTRPAF